MGHDNGIEYNNELFFRAKNRDNAKKDVLDKSPKAKVYR